MAYKQEHTKSSFPFKSPMRDEEKKLLKIGTPIVPKEGENPKKELKKIIQSMINAGKSEDIKQVITRWNN